MQMQIQPHQQQPANPYRSSLLAAGFTAVGFLAVASAALWVAGKSPRTILLGRICAAVSAASLIALFSCACRPRRQNPIDNAAVNSVETCEQALMRIRTLSEDDPVRERLVQESTQWLVTHMETTTLDHLIVDLDFTLGGQEETIRALVQRAPSLALVQLPYTPGNFALRAELQKQRPELNWYFRFIYVSQPRLSTAKSPLVDPSSPKSSIPSPTQALSPRSPEALSPVDRAVAGEPTGRPSSQTVPVIQPGRLYPTLIDTQEIQSARDCAHALSRIADLPFGNPIRRRLVDATTAYLGTNPAPELLDRVRELRFPATMPDEVITALLKSTPNLRYVYWAPENSRPFLMAEHRGNYGVSWYFDPRVRRPSDPPMVLNPGPALSVAQLMAQPSAQTLGS
jgi:hypothetical protein